MGFEPCIPFERILTLIDRASKGTQVPPTSHDDVDYKYLSQHTTPYHTQLEVEVPEFLHG